MVATRAVVFAEVCYVWFSGGLIFRFSLCWVVIVGCETGFLHGCFAMAGFCLEASDCPFG